MTSIFRRGPHRGEIIEEWKQTGTDGTTGDPIYARVLALEPLSVGAGGGGGGAVTVADGANVVEGATTDVAVTGDNAGTISAKLRGLSKMFSDVWDSVNHRFNVAVQNTVAVTGTFWQAIQPVSQSGTWTVQPGNTANTTAWKVDGSAVTQPVSGTVGATQSGTWTVQPGNTANSTAWLVDQQNSATIDYDTGAGTVNQDVIGLALPASGGPVAGGTSSNPVRTDPTGTTAQPVSGTVSAAQSGTWTVQPGNTANTTAWKVDGSAVTQPVSGTVTANQGTANTAANAWPAKVTDGTNVAAVKAASTAAAATDPAAVVAISPNNTVAVTESGTWTVQPGNTQNTTAWLVSLRPDTTGGLSLNGPTVSAASTNATNVKASAGQLYGYYVYNANAAVRYVKFHNNAGTPTAGSGVVLTVAVPPGAAAHVEWTQGITFGTGIAFTMVTGIANSDSAAVAANDLVLTVMYK